MNFDYSIDVLEDCPEDEQYIQNIFIDCLLCKHQITDRKYSNIEIKDYYLSLKDILAEFFPVESAQATKSELSLRLKNPDQYICNINNLKECSTLYPVRILYYVGYVIEPFCRLYLEFSNLMQIEILSTLGLNINIINLEVHYWLNDKLKEIITNFLKFIR